MVDVTKAIALFEDWLTHVWGQWALWRFNVNYGSSQLSSYDNRRILSVESWRLRCVCYSG
jgi:hypothetical protein